MPVSASTSSSPSSKRSARPCPSKPTKTDPSALTELSTLPSGASSSARTPPPSSQTTGTVTSSWLSWLVRLHTPTSVLPSPLTLSASQALHPSGRLRLRNTTSSQSSGRASGQLQVTPEAFSMQASPSQQASLHEASGESGRQGSDSSQTHPGSTPHSDVQPSSAPRLPSSHVSPGSSAPSPHTPGSPLSPAWHSVQVALPPVAVRPPLVAPRPPVPAVASLPPVAYCEPSGRPSSLPHALAAISVATVQLESPIRYRKAVRMGRARISRWYYSFAGAFHAEPGIDPKCVREGLVVAGEPAVL